MLWVPKKRDISDWIVLRIGLLALVIVECKTESTFFLSTYAVDLKVSVMYNTGWK